MANPSPTPSEVPQEQKRLRITRGIPLAKISTVNLLTSATEDVLIDKLNEVIERLNAMNEVPHVR